MQYWNDLDGSTFFSMVFSGRIEIGNIKLFSLNIDTNHSIVTMAFDIKDLPDNPPRKWQSMEYNACRIGISCSEVESVMVRNLPNSELMKLTIQKHGSHFAIAAVSEHSAIEFTTAFLHLRDPSVYLTNTPI
ncbi:Imm50 family immunity protein [Pseudomonas sp. TWP3-2]|uniref:Imm50 family immunity protein n=1 Tax=Pseudomonas sp. TWP3-2 TaxID=2804574 RepID=UPI003CF47BC9